MDKPMAIGYFEEYFELKLLFCRDGKQIRGVLMSIVSRFLISITSRHIGTDVHGNRYYESRQTNRVGHKKRFVVYDGLPEASKIPADWHGWLHRTEDAPPPPEGYPRRAWQKDHLPNLTGTIYARRPGARRLVGGKRPAATGDYDAWTPE
jgi:NADH:ubiquinone oxidoreductase subunit